MFDDTLFTVALLGKAEILRNLYTLQLRMSIPIQYKYNACDDSHRYSIVHGLCGPTGTVPTCIDTNSIFFDIGANIGSLTVPAAIRLKKSLSVHAFEPNPATRELLLNNLEINGVEATVNDIALSDKEGKETFYFDIGKSGSGSLLRERNYERKVYKLEKPTNKLRREITVNTITFDKYLEVIKYPLSFGNIIIKIDVEGFELNVLNGANKFLSTTILPSLIMVETMGSNFTSVLELLTNCDFQLVEEIMPRFFRKVDQPRKERVSDLYFVKNVQAVHGGIFYEWPFSVNGVK